MRYIASVQICISVWKMFYLQWPLPFLGGPMSLPPWWYSHAHINTLHVDTYTHKYNPPMRGTESDVAGMISATRSMKTVSERSTVMPWDRDREGERENMSIYIMMRSGSLVYEISPVITYVQYVISYVLMTTTIYQLLAPLMCLK